MKPAIIRPDLELKREIRNVSERNVIYIRLTGDYKLNDYGGTWGRLFQFIKEQKLPMGDFSPLCIYHDDPKVTPAEKLRTDVCMVMPVKVTPKSDVGFKVIPAGRYAIFCIKVRMTICKLCMIRFTESVCPKWNVRCGMKPARNVI